LGEKLSVTIIATGIDDNTSIHGGFVPRSVPSAASKFGTSHIPPVDAVAYNPTPATPQPAVKSGINERTVSPIRTVNPSTPAAAPTGEIPGLKSRVKDVHMEVPSFLRKKNDE
ncbi:MAG: hypothetical protein J6L84_06880, partial [Clostridiales bacterium]|nr:hypothetical protein [Clostridiales bacterium]